MTTLKEFYTEKEKMYADLRDKAKSAFDEVSRSQPDDVSKSLANAEKGYGEALARSVELEKLTKQARKSLAVALMPSDIEALAETLRDLMAQSRKSNACLIEKEQLIADRKIEKTMASRHLKNAETKLKEIKKEIESVEKREKQHNDWYKIVDDGGVFDDLKKRAGELLNIIETGGEMDPEDPLAKEKKIVSEAKNRITGDIPEDLLERARERGTQLLDLDVESEKLMTNLEKEAGEFRETTFGLNVKVENFRSKYLKAEEDFKDFVLQAKSRYEQGLALFAEITKSALLTEDEKKRINDADLMSAGEKALPVEKERDEKREKEETEQLDYVLALAQAVIKDIDAVTEENTADDEEVLPENEDVPEGGDVPEEGAVTEDDDETEEAEPDPEAMLNNLDLWEAAIPDHIWANAYSYGQAIELLSILEKGDPEALKTAMNDAEKEFVKALEEQDKAMRTVDGLEIIIGGQNDRNEFLRNKRRQRLLSVIRGD